MPTSNRSRRHLFDKGWHRLLGFDDRTARAWQIDCRGRQLARGQRPDVGSHAGGITGCAVRQVNGVDLGRWRRHPLTLVPRLMARVLLVEDEPNIASIIVFKLEREGHQVRWESSASTVLDAAAAIHPDLVLLDSSLPDGDPFALLSALSPNPPVVMMTEFRDALTPHRARAAGALATVEKPFKPTQLARLVAQLVPAA